MRRDLSDVAVVPGAPAGANLSTVWEVDEVGLVASGWLAPGHPDAGPMGSRVVWGAGVWLATMDSNKSSGKMSAEVRIFPGRLTAEFLVRAPHGPVRGVADQPGLGRSLNPLRVLGEQRLERRQVRLRVEGRTWWLRGGRQRRLTRDDGLLVLSTKGSRWGIDEQADGLDYSVAVLAITALDTSTYSFPYY